MTGLKNGINAEITRFKYGIIAETTCCQHGILFEITGLTYGKKCCHSSKLNTDHVSYHYGNGSIVNGYKID